MESASPTGYIGAQIMPYPRGATAVAAVNQSIQRLMEDIQRGHLVLPIFSVVSFGNPMMCATFLYLC
jgi:hypothetical protein